MRPTAGGDVAGEIAGVQFIRIALAVNALPVGLVAVERFIEQRHVERTTGGIARERRHLPGQAVLIVKIRGDIVRMNPAGFGQRACRGESAALIAVILGALLEAMREKVATQRGFPEG